MIDFNWQLCLVSSNERERETQALGREHLSGMSQCLPPAPFLVCQARSSTKRHMLSGQPISVSAAWHTAGQTSEFPYPACSAGVSAAPAVDPCGGGLFKSSVCCVLCHR